MEDNALNFKEALVAQITDYLMVARLENGVAIGGGYYQVSDLVSLLNDITVEDVLTSTNTMTALSANQGRLLNELISTKVNNSLLGVANGVATLDGDGKVPSSQLPSYVDDVVEYDVVGDFPSEGERSKIYVALDTGKMYRWSGTQYTEISSSLTIGETSGTAYDGAKGKANADNIARKINTADIVDNLDDTSTNKPLSANQGKVISQKLTEIENSIQGLEYGIKIDETTGVVTRTGSAIGMSFGTPDGVNPITTDFDDVSIWKDIHAVKISLDGIVKEPTEDDFDTFDGLNMVSIPQGFYIKDERIDGFRYVSVCDKQLVGYYPIKVKYLNAMMASDDGNGNLVCKPNLAPRANISYNTGNTIIKAQGDGNWSMYDITGNYIKWALSSIEAGSINHKESYGKGIQSGMPYGSTGYDIKIASTGNTVTVDSARPFYIGMMVQIGTTYYDQSIAKNRYITDIVDNGDGTQTLTLDGDAFTVTIGDTCVTWGQPIPQAQYDVMKNGSGYILQFGSIYRSHVFYRGMPLHGNQWVLTDGFRRYDGEYYGCTDPQFYGASDIRTSEGWTKLGYNIQSANGYQKTRQAIKIDGGSIDVPVEWGNIASSETFYSAYLYGFSTAETGDKVLRLGGNWYSGSVVSPVCSVGNDSPSSSSFDVGCGLIRY